MREGQENGLGERAMGMKAGAGRFNKLTAINRMCYIPWVHICIYMRVSGCPFTMSAFYKLYPHRAGEDINIKRTHVNFYHDRIYVQSRGVIRVYATQRDCRTMTEYRGLTRDNHVS